MPSDNGSNQIKQSSLSTEEVTDRPDSSINEENDEHKGKILSHWVNDRWEEAETSARQTGDMQMWDEWVEAYWGEAPPDSLPSYRQPVLTTEMRDLILYEAQEITDTKPVVHITGANIPPPISAMIKDAMRAKWVSADVQGALLEAVIWSKILPCGWIGVYWDPTLADGMGDIAVSAEDPRCILPAPQARDDKTWPYVIKEDWLDLYAIRSMWPDIGHRVREDTPPTYTGKMPKSRSSPYLGPMFMSPGQQSQSSPAIPQARVLSIWVRDPGTEIKLDPIRDQSGQIISVKSRHVMKYPRGRFVQVAGDVVLADQPWRCSSFPLFRILSQPAIGSFFPASLVRDLTPIQQAVDKAWEQLIQNMERVNEGVWFTTGETGVDPSNFTPMPGMVVQGEAGSTLEMKAPPAFPESFMKAPDHLASIMRRKTGHTGARAGEVKGANVGQGLLETEISQAETPTRMTATLLYKSVMRISQHILETMALMYRTKRVIPLFESGKPRMIDWQPLDENQVVNLLAHIDPASFQPRSETLEKGLILKAAAMGLVGPEYVLNHIQLPDTEEANKERNTQLYQIWSMMQKRGAKGARIKR